MLTFELFLALLKTYSISFSESHVAAPESFMNLAEWVKKHATMRDLKSRS